MTPEELLTMLVNHHGPCMRICAYCPEDIKTAEIKECVEEMIRQQYITRKCNDDLLKELIKIRGAYLMATGKEYKGEDKDT